MDKIFETSFKFIDSDLKQWISKITNKQNVG